MRRFNGFPMHETPLDASRAIIFGGYWQFTVVQQIQLYILITSLHQKDNSVTNTYVEVTKAK